MVNHITSQITTLGNSICPKTTPVTTFGNSFCPQTAPSQLCRMLLRAHYFSSGPFQAATNSTSTTMNSASATTITTINHNISCGTVASPKRHDQTTSNELSTQEQSKSVQGAPVATLQTHDTCGTT